MPYCSKVTSNDLRYGYSEAYDYNYWGFLFIKIFGTLTILAIIAATAKDNPLFKRAEGARIVDRFNEEYELNNHYDSKELTVFKPVMTLGVESSRGASAIKRQWQESAENYGLHFLGETAKAAAGLAAVTCTGSALGGVPQVPLCFSALGVAVIASAIYKGRVQGNPRASGREREYPIANDHKILGDVTDQVSAEAKGRVIEAARRANASNILFLQGVWGNVSYTSLFYERNGLNHTMVHKTGDTINQGSEHFDRLYKLETGNLARTDVTPNSVVYLIKWADANQEKKYYEDEANVLNNQNADIDYKGSYDLFDLTGYQSSYCMQAKHDGESGIEIKGQLHFDGTDGFDDDCDAQENIM